MAQAQGSKGLLSLQYEATYGVKPTADTPVIAADMTKVYFESEGFKATRNLLTSTILTGARTSPKPVAGNIDVQGSITTEFGGDTATLLAGLCGSVYTVGNSGTGEVNTIISCTGAVIDPGAGTMTFTASAHGLAVGGTIVCSTLFTPAALNGAYFRIIKVTTNTITVRIKHGISGAVTLGSVFVVTTPTTTYTHNFYTGGVLPSFTVEKGFPDLAQYFLYTGCKVGKMTLNLTPEGFQKVSFDLTGLREAVSGTSYDSTITASGKQSFSGGMTATILEAGGNVLTNKVTKIDVSVENSLDTGLYCLGGAAARAAVTEGTVKVTGTLEALFENLTYYNKAVSSAPTDLSITVTRGTGDGTTVNEALTIIIPELIFKQDTPVISGDKGLLVTLPFETFYTNNAHQSQLRIGLSCGVLAI